MASRLRTARCARLRLGRLCKNEENGFLLNARSSVVVPSGEELFLAREQSELLHEEIERLPRAFRLPVVLCYLEGLTVHEAARRLGCSHGTVRSRMARRERLRRCLLRRGIGLPATALAAALAARNASASVSSHLCETTARSAVQFAAGQSAAPVAVAIAQEVLRTMLFHKLRLIPLALLILGTLATSVGYLSLGSGFERRTQFALRPVGNRRSRPSPTMRNRSRVRGGCSWWAACLIPRASRWQCSGGGRRADPVETRIRCRGNGSGGDRARGR